MRPTFGNRRLNRHPLITKLELFVNLSTADKEILLQTTRQKQRQVGAHEDIICEGDAPQTINLILSGWAYRYKQLEDGRRQILAYLLPGDICDLNIFLLKTMDHSIGTITPVGIAEVPRETVQELVEGGHRISQALRWSALVAEAIEREWIVNLGQRTALERVGHLFCELFFRLRAVGHTSGNSCELPLTQAELADTVGLSTVHINRTLQELRAQELIMLQGKTLTILDLERLQTLSLFSPAYLHLDREGRELDAAEG